MEEEEEEEEVDEEEEEEEEEVDPSDKGLTYKKSRPAPPPYSSLAKRVKFASLACFIACRASPVSLLTVGFQEKDPSLYRAGSRARVNASLMAVWSGSGSG